MKKFKKIIPSRESIEKFKILRPIAHLLSDPRVWHFNRRGVASGLAVGVFVGFLPIPAQMLLTAIIVIFIRVNLGVGLVATWITNPVTMPIIFPFNYYIGCLLLNIKPSLPDINSFDSLIHLGGDVVVPLYFGSIVNGVVFALLSLSAVRGLWRYNIVKSYNVRRRRLLLKKREKQVNHSKGKSK